MTPRHAAPVTVRSAALERAWSTFKQGILVDALGAIGLGLTSLLTTADISSQVFWTAVALLVVKSFLVATASFLVRLHKPLSGTVVHDDADGSPTGASAAAYGAYSVEPMRSEATPGA